MNANTTSADSKMDARDRSRILKILESNWQAEMRGFHTYEILAERETDPARRAALRTLSYAEQHHAQMWAERIRALGGPDPTYHGPNTGEADTIANRVGGVGMALRRLELDESRDIAKYAKQIKELGDEPSVRILQQALEDEREHYRTLSGLIRNRRPLPHPSPQQPKRLSTNFWLPGRKIIQKQPAGSVTPSTESTTVSGRSSESFPAFPERRWATANLSSSRGWWA